MPDDVEQLIMSRFSYIDEFPFGEVISNGFQERMPVGFTTSKCVESDLVSGEINMGSDQTVRPRTVDHNGVTEQAHATVSIGSVQVNNAADQPSLEIELPRARKQASAGRGLDTQSSTLTVGDRILSGLRLQVRKGVEMEALPNFGLPASVEAFDSGLEAGFPWRSKDCGHSQAQAKADDSSNAPMTNPSTTDGAIGRRGNQPSVQRCDIGQVSAGWRRWMASSIPTIQCTTPPQNASDGAQCGNPGCPSCDQFSLNGLRSVFAQDAAVVELPVAMILLDGPHSPSLYVFRP